jgi:hypothetical protein
MNIIFRTDVLVCPSAFHRKFVYCIIKMMQQCSKGQSNASFFPQRPNTSLLYPPQLLRIHLCQQLSSVCGREGCVDNWNTEVI